MSIPALLLAVLLLPAGPDEAGERRAALDHAALTARLGELVAAHPGLASRLELGASRSGLAIEALVIARGGRPLAERTGVLVVGSLDGRRGDDAGVVLDLAGRLLARDDLDAVLGDHALVLLPRPSPDGVQALLGAGGPRREQAGNGRPDDLDRDARVDEDGPADLDGDGRITWMRVPDPEGEWVLDAGDPRALRKARRERGERGTHRLVVEGRDADGDGEIAEDGVDGAHVDRNFPHGFVEHDPASGGHPLSEPEARALADLLLGHRGLAAVLQLGDHDTLETTPRAAGKVERGGWGDTFLAPPDGLLEDDVTTMKELGRRWAATAAGAGDRAGGDGRAPGRPAGKAGGRGAKSGAPGLSDGSLLAWAYHQAGRWPLAARAWSPPAERPAETTAEGDDEAGDDEAGDDDDDDDEGDDDAPGSDPDSPVPAAVLAWLDAERGGAGIVAWHGDDHPDLGPVEIGGLEPGTLHGVPQDAADELARRAEAYLVDLLAAWPRLAFEKLQVERRADGLYTVRVDVANVGVLPTAPALAGEARLQRPLRVRLLLPDGAARLAGPAEELVDRIAGGGGRVTLRWVVSAPAGGTLRIEADADGVDDASREIPLP